MEIDVEELKKMIEEMELAMEFDNIEAERCLICCGSHSGGWGC